MYPHGMEIIASESQRPEMKPYCHIRTHNAIHHQVQLRWELDLCTRCSTPLIYAVPWSYHSVCTVNIKANCILQYSHIKATQWQRNLVREHEQNKELILVLAAENLLIDHMGLNKTHKFISNALFPKITPNLETCCIATSLHSTS